ncbi:iron complex transport system substrate-binding protein [Lachnospiraceae bacterium]|nr:iron complex transport system substrate-binding protein [Lachnospiraceae bacterium]
MMKKKFLTLTLCAAAGLSLLCGCGQKETSTPETTEVTTVAEQSDENSEATNTTEEETTEAAEVREGTAATDRAGNEIFIPDKVDKIISMAPSTTRFLIDLGLGDKIIAIDTNSYAYAASLTDAVQQFDMMAPDNEALVALNPDIIFTSGMSNIGGEDVYKPARDAGICVADIPSSNSIDDIIADLKFIGEAVHEEDKAGQLIDYFNGSLEDIILKGREVTEKKKILFELSIPTADYPSIYTFGKGTYLDEMINDIGAENVTGDQEGWISISEEEAIAMNPDVIITNVNYVDDAVNAIKTAEGWENVTAIQNGAVYYIDADASNQPNNHIIDAMLEMAKQVYPDTFN